MRSRPNGGGGGGGADIDPDVQMELNAMLGGGGNSSIVGDIKLEHYRPSPVAAVAAAAASVRPQRNGSPNVKRSSVPALSDVLTAAVLRSRNGGGGGGGGAAAAGGGSPLRSSSNSGNNSGSNNTKPGATDSALRSLDTNVRLELEALMRKPAHTSEDK